MSTTETLSLASDIKPLCSLSLHVRRVSESVVGRPLELAAVEQAVRAAHTSFTGLRDRDGRRLRDDRGYGR